ncbi:MAG TPA: pyridoxamine 5'-phosphate oxidase family protein [Ilumatobacteraceae bacterium]
MTASDRETFLELPHVAVLAIARADGEPPLASPVWYDYQRGGDVIVTIGADSEKAKRLAVSPVASVCVQTTELPYRFVTVSGPVTLGPADSGIRRRIAARYLPPELVDGYLEGAEDEAQMLTVRLTPGSWRSNDFSKMG